MINRFYQINHHSILEYHKMSRKGKKNNPIIELSIDSIGFEGVSVSRLEGQVYFVKYAVPGDTVRVQITRKRKKHSEGKLLEIINTSPLRVPPICSHFGTCGGCSWQNLDYTEQIKWKQQHVVDAFERVGKVNYNKLNTILPSPNEFHYRNKMEFSFGASRWLNDNEIKTTEEISNKNFALGLHIPGRFDKILEIKQCHIQQDEANMILDYFKINALKFGVSAYHHKLHTGFLKNLVIRYSRKNDNFMIILVTNKIASTHEEEFISMIFDEVPKKFEKVASLIHAVNDTLSPVAAGTINRTFGSPYLIDSILDIHYRISPFSFFQTNSEQLNQFVKLIIDLADVNQNHVVWDLYCGTGSITLPISKHCNEVYGFELVQSSIEDARLNAELNTINNTKFYDIDLHSDKAFQLFSELPMPDVLIIDPPRAGIHGNLIEQILKLNCSKLVYVSCNPMTQARDCGLLSEKYEVVSLNPVDMFPHTYHVENIAVLILKDNV